MQYMIIADLHGNTEWAKRMVDEAVSRGIDTIVQLGDFGIWPGPKGDKYLRKLSEYLGLHGIKLLFVDGNHEDFPKLYRWPIDPATGLRPIDLDGTKQGVNIWHIPRGHVWEAEGLRFMGVGGAVSIDREYRIPGKSWWPEEQLTGEDLVKVREQGRVDVLFTHDCPTSVPYTGLKADPESHIHRQKMNEVADITQPALWFHGHMHKPMHYWHRTINDMGLDIEVIGLDCDNQRHCFCVFDVSRRTVDFPTDQEHTVFHTRPREPWYSRQGFWPGPPPGGYGVLD